MQKRAFNPTSKIATFCRSVAVKPFGKLGHYISARKLAATAATALALYSPLTSPALAQMQNWQNIEGGRIRMSYDAAKNSSDSGWSYGLIELELKPGWKTYWKNPGNSGMAPELHFDQKQNADILFPSPKLIESGKSWAFGYQNKVLIPFRLTTPPTDADLVSGKLMIGICEALCVPAEVPFSFKTKETPDFLTKGRIQAALADLPKPADKGFSVVSATAKGKHLLVALKAPASDKTPQIYLDAGDTQLGIPKIERREGDTTHYAVPIVSGKLKQGQKIDYIAVAANQAISGSVTAPENEK